MRYVTVRVTPTDGTAFHPLGQALGDEPSVTREATHRNELLDDGTAVILAEVRGDRDRYEEILEKGPTVVDFAVTGADGWWDSYTRYEPTDLTRRMLEERPSVGCQRRAREDRPIALAGGVVGVERRPNPVGDPLARRRDAAEVVGAEVGGEVPLVDR